MFVGFVTNIRYDAKQDQLGLTKIRCNCFFMCPPATKDQSNLWNKTKMESV